MAEVDEELAQLGVVLVEERVLRRVIKAHRRIPGIGLQVPHEQCYSLPRSELARRVEPDEIAIDLERLPDPLIVVSGDRGALAAGAQDALSRAWRQVFHARIHLAFDARLASGELTAAAIRERINRIGQTEFDEIRSVLRQEELLLPPIDDARTYIEFAALYLELRWFAPRSLERTFTLLDTGHVDATLALDVDAPALLAAARPARAPADPVVDEAAPEPLPPRAPPAPITDPSARRAASAARLKGNRSRAAILSARCGDLDGARRDLDELVARLSRVLADAPAAGWAEALLPVARAAAGQRMLRFTPGARLLHDLQAACVIAEREVKVVDPVTWALSLGKRPVVRALPATREIRVAKRLHAAADKVAACELDSVEARDQLARAVGEMASRADDNVRRVVRPNVEAALEQVGLTPHSLPERVGGNKLVDELLDQAVALGRLSLGNLRDAVSRNELKMNDLAAGELRRGDQLMRCDDQLSRSLDGVYRRGESYMRFLHKLQSVLFGTRIGRVLSLYVLLPVLGAATVLEGLQHMVAVVSVPLFDLEPLISTRQMIAAGSLFLFLVLHVTPFRRALVWLLRLVGRGLRWALIDLPRALWRVPLIRRLIDNRFIRWVIKPALPAAVVVLVVPGILRWPLAVAVFLAFELLLGSRFGRLAEEMVTDSIVRSGRHLTGRIIPALVKWVLALFTGLIELLDRAIYRVDEALRFKQGQSLVSLVIKGVLGTLWFVVTYLLRLYVNLFVEPTVNPIKHFPVVTVAAKIIVPFLKAMQEAIAAPSSQLLGTTLGNGFAAFTVLVLPGIAGFLVWELRANWKLYRATRPKLLHEVAFGHHGETMVSFLRPGFHSGTIPKLFTKLRRAAWRGDELGVARRREALHHVEEAIAKFAGRGLVALLNEAPAFRASDLATGHIDIKSNRVQIDIACPSLAAAPATIRFEQQSGWLVASVPELGWVAGLDADQRRIFETALAGFYKLSGVDLVREQIEHALAGGAGEPPAYDIADEGMLVWPGGRYETEAVYDLRSPGLQPGVRGARLANEPPVVAGKRALFCREPLPWSVWSTAWQQIARGEPPMQVIPGPGLLRAAPPQRQRTATLLSRTSEAAGSSGEPMRTD